MRNTLVSDARKTGVLKRAIQPEEGNLSLSAARALLTFQLAQPDRDRLHDLLVKNQSDKLSALERDELDGFLTIGMVFDLLQAKARAALKNVPSRFGNNQSAAHLPRRGQT